MISKLQLQNDLKEAMKARDSLKKSVISGLLAAAQLKSQEKRTNLSKTISDVSELEKQQELTEEELMQVINSEAKKRREAEDQFTKGGRPELAQKEKEELEVILTYLPAQLGEEEIRSIIKNAIEQSGAHGPQEIGKVMPLVMKETKGKADGSLVSKIVKEMLDPIS